MYIQYLFSYITFQVFQGTFVLKIYKQCLVFWEVFLIKIKGGLHCFPIIFYVKSK